MDQENTVTEPVQPAIPPAEQPYAMPEKKQNLAVVTIAIVVFVLGIIGFGIFLILTIFKTVPKNLTQAINIPSSSQKTFVMTADDLTPEPLQKWQVYANQEYGVIFKHPSAWSTLEHFKGKTNLVGFEVAQPYYVIFEKVPYNGISADINPRSVHGITWYDADPNKAADKAGTFCELYNCDQQTYARYSTFKDGYRYSFYTPTDMKTIMSNVLTSFTFSR